MRAIKFRPSAEGLLFFRAVAGCVLNLRAIGARAEPRPVFEELATLAPAATRNRHCARSHMVRLPREPKTLAHRSPGSQATGFFSSQSL